MNDNTKTILKGLGIGLAILGGLIGIVVISKKANAQQSGSDVEDKNLNIIIGDSQTPFITRQSQKITMLGSTGGEQNLWLGGMGLKWLKNAVAKYPVTKKIKNVVINIGTNGGFSKSDDIKGLVGEIKRVFPSAKLFVVQGSWGWGGNAGTSSATVKAYYDRFANEGVKVINPPIGVVADPHGNLPIYVEIGRSIDSII